MIRLTSRSIRHYRIHGWSTADMEYLEANADLVETDENWSMAKATAPDGVVWLYPTSPGNEFPLSLWKRIKWYIDNNANVVIPMSRNQENVARVAKKYNGYLDDNLYMFGDALQDVRILKEANRWSHSLLSLEHTKPL